MFAITRTEHSGSAAAGGRAGVRRGAPGVRGGQAGAAGAVPVRARASAGAGAGRAGSHAPGGGSTGARTR